MHRDGSVFPAQITVASLNSANEIEDRLCISILDISSRKAGEEALLLSRNELQSIIDNAPGLICLKDPDARYLFVNQNFADFFRIDRKSVRGRNDYDLFPPKVADTFRCWIVLPWCDPVLSRRSSAPTPTAS